MPPPHPASSALCNSPKPIKLPENTQDPMPVEPKSSARKFVVFRGIFLAMFLVAGIGLVREGSHAIRDQAYTLNYTEELRWASDSAQLSARVEQQAAEYQGRDAMVFGIGFAALGTMLLAWSTGLALGLRRHMPRPAVLAIGGVSLVAMSTACLALFPPWRLHTLPMYGVVAAFTLAVTLPIPARWRKKVFPAMAGLVILIGMTGFPAFPIFAGIFVFLMAGTHVLVLWPGLAPEIARIHRTGQARHPPSREVLPP